MATYEKIEYINKITFISSSDDVTSNKTPEN